MTKGGKRILIPVVETPFSKAWVDENPWMGEVNDEDAKQPNSMCMFINFPNGVPVPKLRKNWERIVNYHAEQEKNLSIFREMMKEKGIRPGVGSVGVKHKGWGNSLQK